jgi:hypothetical protein
MQGERESGFMILSFCFIDFVRYMRAINNNTLMMVS